MRHKRVAELQFRGQKSVSPEIETSELVDKPWPSIDEVLPPHEITPRTRTHYETMVREYEERIANETPNTKRRRLEEFSKIGSPDIRDFLSPSYPAREHQRFLDEEQRRAQEMMPTPSPEPKKSTVINKYRNV